jgi:signal transduction histidine kinase
MATTPQLGRLLMPHGPFRVRVLLAMVRHRWFIHLRWLFAVAAVALLTLERMLSPEFRRPLALAVCIFALALVNVVWVVLSKHLLGPAQNGTPAEEGHMRRVVLLANAQMTVDLLILTFVLRFSGGVENPMSVFYLFHVVIAALLLRPFNALIQGFWGLGLFAWLGVGECAEWIVPHYPFTAGTVSTALHADWGFVLLTIASLGAGVVGVLYFTLQISANLDEQERELLETNEALKTSQVVVRDLQARRSRFMQTAAHQLKSPLTGIEMLASLIRDNVVHGESIRGVVGRIIDRCREAIVQVTELLTLARIEDAAPTRHLTADTELGGVVRRVAARFQDQATARNLQLHVDTARCDPCGVAVDERDLEDCIGNLLDNAIKYNSPGGAVWISAESIDTGSRVSVRDSGIGIVEEVQDDIFDPFRRGNLALASNIPGSGLGLAIVREVVEQAGGEITVRSRVGDGSEFTILFPRRTSAATQRAVRPTRRTRITRQDAQPARDTGRR